MQNLILPLDMKVCSGKNGCGDEFPRSMFSTMKRKYWNKTDAIWVYHYCESNVCNPCLNRVKAESQRRSRRNQRRKEQYQLTKTGKMVIQVRGDGIELFEPPNIPWKPTGRTVVTGMFGGTGALKSITD